MSSAAGDHGPELDRPGWPMVPVEQFACKNVAREPEERCDVPNDLPRRGLDSASSWIASPSSVRQPLGENSQRAWHDREGERVVTCAWHSSTVG